MINQSWKTSFRRLLREKSDEGIFREQDLLRADINHFKNMLRLTEEKLALVQDELEIRELHLSSEDLEPEIEYDSN